MWRCDRQTPLEAPVVPDEQRITASTFVVSPKLGALKQEMTH